MKVKKEPPDIVKEELLNVKEEKVESKLDSVKSDQTDQVKVAIKAEIEDEIKEEIPDEERTENISIKPVKNNKVCKESEGKVEEKASEINNEDENVSSADLQAAEKDVADDIKNNDETGNTTSEDVMRNNDF